MFIRFVFSFFYCSFVWAMEEIDIQQERSFNIPKESLLKIDGIACHAFMAIEQYAEELEKLKLDMNSYLLTMMDVEDHRGFYASITTQLNLGAVYETLSELLNRRALNISDRYGRYNSERLKHKDNGLNTLPIFMPLCELPEDVLDSNYGGNQNYLFSKTEYSIMNKMNFLENQLIKEIFYLIPDPSQLPNDILMQIRMQPSLYEYLITGDENNNPFALDLTLGLKEGSKYLMNKQYHDLPDALLIHTYLKPVDRLLPMNKLLIDKLPGGRIPHRRMIWTNPDETYNSHDKKRRQVIEENNKRSQEAKEIGQMIKKIIPVKLQIVPSEIPLLLFPDFLKPQQPIAMQEGDNLLEKSSLQKMKQPKKKKHKKKKGSQQQQEIQEDMLLKPQQMIVIQEENQIQQEKQHTETVQPIQYGMELFTERQSIQQNNREIVELQHRDRDETIEVDLQEEVKSDQVIQTQDYRDQLLSREQQDPFYRMRAWAERELFNYQIKQIKHDDWESHVTKIPGVRIRKNGGSDHFEVLKWNPNKKRKKDGTLGDDQVVGGYFRAKTYYKGYIPRLRQLITALGYQNQQ